MAPTRVPLFHRITDGIRITARPTFLHERSSASIGQYVFEYRIRIENCGEQSAQLRTRRWVIHDEAAGEQVVEGDGVVGEQPYLSPGDVHEYRSFCVLTCPRGWMEGSYGFLRDDGSAFDALIPRFLLHA
ncbi:MAG: Co2+/Mg2+ efflux protein ApaG [Gemmatimonadaceae bacterium]|nr:Co2+/Mg2+ efflux protein ApaG [Gemmatimonadaceae bacterium]